MRKKNEEKRRKTRKRRKTTKNENTGEIASDPSYTNPIKNLAIAKSLAIVIAIVWCTQCWEDLHIPLHGACPAQIAGLEGQFWSPHKPRNRFLRTPCGFQVLRRFVCSRPSLNRERGNRALVIVL